MAETRGNEPEKTAARQGSRNGEGGARQQSENLARQESGGRAGGALSQRAPRQLSYGLQQSPFTMMRQLSREMDRLMDAFFSPGLGSALREARGSRGEGGWEAPSLWTPKIDVQQRNDALVVSADLPGVRKEDIQIDVDENTLILSGERREEREEGSQDQGYQLYERSYGSFYREVPLPPGVKPEDIKAEMREGVLKVTVPLPENVRPRRVQIQG